MALQHPVASLGVASLPMYDFEEIRWATDAFWQALARELGTSIELDRTSHYAEPWTKPNMIFSQTCGYPLVHKLTGKVRYVATPHYGAHVCDGPNYGSIVYVRDGDSRLHARSNGMESLLMQFAGSRPAINSPDSMSGMLALKLAFDACRDQPDFFSPAVWTGGHLASLDAVQNGNADVCSIDCVTVALAMKHRPHLFEGLRKLTSFAGVPGLPFITNALEPEFVRAALQRVFADPTLKNARDEMLLTGLSVLPSDAYDLITKLEMGIGDRLSLR